MSLITDCIEPTLSSKQVATKREVYKIILNYKRCKFVRSIGT